MPSPLYSGERRSVHNPGNTTIATAIVDRLVENSEIFLLGGDSLRKAKTSSTTSSAE